MNWGKAITFIKQYAVARQAFCDAQNMDDLKDLLNGNDNKVGVCGEFWAKHFYVHQLGHSLITPMPSSNNEGFDFQHKNGEKDIRVSVKVISIENMSRETPKFKRTNWDELCIVLLDENLLPYRIGKITIQEVDNTFTTEKISVKEFDLDQRGRIGIFGEVYLTSPMDTNPYMKYSRI